MTILSAQGERETRRITEAARGAVNHFGNRRERLERSRAKIFHKQSDAKSRSCRL
jgi:hypothetical protein